MTSSGDQEDAVSPRLAEALARGRAVLRRLLEAAGGLWSTEEVAQRFGVPPATVQEWLGEGRLLALRRADGTYLYPAAQFELQGTKPPGLPSPAIAQVIEAAGDGMTPEELAGFLATPRRSLGVVGDAAAGDAPRLRTGFQALAGGDTEQVLAVIRRFVTPADAGAWDLYLAELLAEGQEALLQALEEAGGLWSTEEVARQFGAMPAAVQEWLRQEQLLAVRRIDGSLMFPAAQFEVQGIGGLVVPRSFACIEAIIQAAGDMNRAELAGLLATPQEMLASGATEGSSPRVRTGFEAIADGDCGRVIELVRDLAIPADEGAPPMPENRPL